MLHVQDAICDKMEDDFNKKLDVLRKANELAADAMSRLNDTLDSIIPTDDFNTLLNSIPPVPDITDTGTMDQIKDIIANCAYLGDSPQFSNPITLLRGIVGSLTGAARSVLNALNLPEINAAMIMNELRDLFGVKGLDLKSLISAMDKILNCLTAVCGRETEQKIADMQSLMDKLRLTNSGELDTQKIYSDKGLTGQVVTNIKSANSKILDAQNSITDQVKSFKIPGIDNVPGLNKIPGF